MTRARAYAKLNLALVVGPRRGDGRHEVETVLEAIDLWDAIELERTQGLVVDGFPEDTLVRSALAALAEAAGAEPGWHVRIEKRIPVAAGLGGGSSDAAAALELANATLPDPLAPVELHRIAKGIGADVPFFLRDPPQLATGDGTELSSVALPREYSALVHVPSGQVKESTAAVYAAFDEGGRAGGFAERRASLRAALDRLAAPRDLAALPPNDLASSPCADELLRLGAFRADVSGAGPAVYGLFERRDAAEHAASTLVGRGRTWLTRPVVPGGSDDGNGKMDPLWGVAKW